MNVGRAIRDRRCAKGMTQSELAEQVAVSRPMIAQIERGSKQPSLPLGKAIADALGCNVEDLVSEDKVI